VRKAFAAASLVALTTLAVLVLGRVAVAWAVVRAPNCGIDKPPQPAPPSDVSSILQVPVGPPRAMLAAWILAPAAARPAGTVLVLHGIRQQKSDMLSIGRALRDAGWRAVLVDLRGHGASTGSYLTYGVVESRDLVVLLDALAARFDVGPVGAWGYSYGAAIAIQLAERDARVRGVVAVAPFSTLRGAVEDYAHRYLPGSSVMPAAWLQGGVDWAGIFAHFGPDAASPLRAAAHVGPRLFVAHGTEDSQVTPRHSFALAAAAGPRARYLPVEGADHASVANDARVRAEGLAWLAQSLELAAPVGVTRDPFKDRSRERAEARR
jgi:pimeloyl-ACP methyl ester carboxylesterase